LANDSQKTPVEILELPTSPDSSNLENEDSIVLEQIIDLLQEGRVSPDPDMFGHFQADDLVELSSRGGQVTEIGTEDSSLRRLDAVLLKTVVSKGSLLASEGDYESRYRISRTSINPISIDMSDVPPVTSQP
jgi:hypothetical protein